MSSVNKMYSITVSMLQHVKIDVEAESREAAIANFNAGTYDGELLDKAATMTPLIWDLDNVEYNAIVNTDPLDT